MRRVKSAVSQCTYVQAGVDRYVSLSCGAALKENLSRGTHRVAAESR
jgi:hypothetical protein